MIGNRRLTRTPSFSPFISPGAVGHVPFKEMVIKFKSVLSGRRQVKIFEINATN